MQVKSTKKKGRKGKQYPKPAGGFKVNSNAQVWTRSKDVDTAVYYPNRKLQK